MKKVFIFVNILLSAFVIMTETAQVFNVTDLNRLIAIHNTYCAPRSSPETSATTSSPTTEIVTQTPPNWDNDTVSLPPPPPPPPPACCKDCSRNKSSCILYGTCCPEVLERVPTVEETATTIRYSCEHAQIRPFSVHYPNGEMIWQIKTCANAHNVSGTIATKCESSDNFADLDTKQYVTDNETHVAYRNKYCALCNGVAESRIIHWEPLILCVSNAQFYPDSIGTVVSGIYKTEKCNIVFKLPAYARKLPANYPVCGEQSNRPISHCNTTGQWPVYDALIEAGCYAYKSVYTNIVAEMPASTVVPEVYRNIFCYICNNISPPNTQCTIQHSPNVIIAFSALLKVTQSSNEELKSVGRDCSDIQVFDPYKNICRNLTCTPPKVMVNRRCESILDDVRGVRYRVFIKFAPTTALPYSPDTANTVNALELYTLGIFKDMCNAIELFQIFYTNRSTADKTSGMNITTTVAYFVAFLELSFPYYRNGFINSGIAVERFLSVDGRNIVVTSNIRMEQINYATTLEYMETIGNDVTNLHLKSLDDGKILTRSPMCNYSVTPVRRSTYSDGAVIITNLLTCPLIKLESTEFDICIDVGKAHIRDLNVSFSRSQFSEQDAEDRTHRSILVCLEPYLAAIQTDAIALSISENSHTVVEIFSLTCTCLSLVCLLMSLVTYILFKELRTQPGINNMILIVSLICAQSIFQFGIGQSLNIADWACKTIGVIVHFLWLLVLLSMNVCSLHMMRVFNRLRQAGPVTFSLRTTVVYLSYCITVSAAVVAAHVIVSLSTSNWTELGYGGGMCYISDKHLLTYFFIAPVGFLVAANIVLFLSTVITISRMPTVESSVKNTRNYFKIYAKLSSVTGMTWAFGFVYYFTKVGLLEYIFITFNACQGIFVFVSFVCNQRVFVYYNSLFCRKTTSVKKSVKTAYTVHNS